MAATRSRTAYRKHAAQAVAERKLERALAPTPVDSTTDLVAWANQQRGLLNPGVES